MSLPTGAYGLILPPSSVKGMEDPRYVTKVFHTKQAYNDFMKKTNRIRTIFQGDPNYLAHRFDRNLTLSNVDDRYKSAVARQFIRNSRRNTKVKSHDQPIYAVYMPHLGVDLTQINGIRERLRAIPIPIMLTNIHELLEKVAMLWNNDTPFIHGDVRPPNIMIQPETGKVTLIDFDWLMEVREFAATYRPVTERIIPSMMGNGKHKKVLITNPHIPPELLLSTISQHPDATNLSNETTDIKSTKTSRIIRDYCSELHKRFTYIEPYIKSALTATTRDCETMLEKAMKDSISYGNEIVTQGRFPIMESYRTLDGYGIGQNLLELSHQLYPGSLTYASDPSMTLDEKRALHTMIHYVLKPLCAFSLRDRKHVGEVLGIASSILASLDQQTAKPANEAKPTNEAKSTDEAKPTNQQNKQGGTYRLKRSKQSKKTRRHNIPTR